MAQVPPSSLQGVLDARKKTQVQPHVISSTLTTTLSAPFFSTGRTAVSRNAPAAPVGGRTEAEASGFRVEVVGSGLDIAHLWQKVLATMSAANLQIKHCKSAEGK